MEFSGTTVTTSSVWRRSSRCTVGSCVEVLAADDRFLIRDSKQLSLGDAQPVITVGRSTWKVFLNELIGVESADANGVLTVTSLSDGWVELVDTTTHVSLSYDAVEWRAFVEGVELGEFSPPVPV